MDVNLLREVVTVVSFATFIAIVAWAAHPGNRKRFEQAARIALDDDGPSPQPSLFDHAPKGPRGEGANVGGGFENARRQ